MPLLHSLRSGAQLGALLWAASLLPQSVPAAESTATRAAAPAPPSFAIGDQDFLLDGRRLQIRCGELHFARVPREYWRDRLRRAKAMGLNAVCAYLFWNVHEPSPGQFTWTGQADAAEFCRIAHEEGLWVILRPGPYACAEWEMGGLPWWLLKTPDIQLRTRDPRFLAPTRRWLAEVGRVLGPQQVTHGGPILMVQVENEYGFYGTDVAYLEDVKQALVAAGFDVPLFACNPTNALKAPTPADLFKVVNFGKDPATGFKALRAVQPQGPLMCGEFYPGWFDTWGAPHHLGNTATYLADLEYMLSHGGSFSIYMAHGGTSFGLWSGADRPFKPDTSSYDYDAPIAENGAVGEKFAATRALLSRYLLPGETLPPVPANPAVMAVPEFALTEVAPVFANLPAARRDDVPRTFEAYDQPRGAIVYRTTLPAGPAAVLEAKEVHDFGFVYLDGQPAGVMDRRNRNYRVVVPARTAPARLDLLVYALGRVNFGVEVHDRKGVHAPVTLRTGDGAGQVLAGWEVYSIGLDDTELAALRWQPAAAHPGPAFWRGTFQVEQPTDTYLDLSRWGFGVVWVNGHCLARFWNIGPTQTAYLPAPWLRAGRNEIVVFDLTGPTAPVIAGLEHPVLNALHPERDFSPKPAAPAKLALDGAKPVVTGRFAAGSDSQTVRFPLPASGRQFCLEALSAQDGGPVAAIAELDLLDPEGRPLPHTNWTIAFVDSEERAADDGSAGNAIDGQTANAWITTFTGKPAPSPHRLVIDLGATTPLGGFRYTPRSGVNAAGRIKDYRVYLGAALVKP